MQFALLSASSEIINYDLVIYCSINLLVLAV